MMDTNAGQEQAVAGRNADFQIAACGLYCGACRKYVGGKCPGCLGNEKAAWCKIRSCCLENGYRSCADCKLMPLEQCGKFNNLIGKVFAFVFRSDRPACIARIKETGYETYAGEMRATNRQTIRRK